MLDNKITTVLIEKNQKDLKELQSIIKKSGYLSLIGNASTGQKAYSIIANYAPQLVIINVDLQDISGLEFVRILHNRNIFPEVIFTADDPHLAYDAMEFEPLDYMVKPFKKEDFANLAERLKNKLKKRELFRKMDLFTKANSITPKRVFRQKTGIVIIELNEIVYIKASLTNSELILNSGEKVSLKTSLNQTIESIDHENFVRTNRSYCINRDYLQKIDKTQLKCILHMDGKIWEVPVSKNTIGQLEKISVYPV